MAAPVLQSSNSAVNSGAATSLTIPVPSNIAIDDVLIAGVDTARQAGPITAPSGWTLLTSVFHDSGTYDWFYKVAVTLDTAAIDYTFSWSTSSRVAGWIVRISGADPTTPISADTSTTGSGNAPDPPASGTVSSGNYLAVAHFGIEGKNAAGATAPTNYTLAQAVETSGSGSQTTHCGVGVASRQLTGITSEDPGTFSTGNDGYAVGTILVKEYVPPNVTVSPAVIATAATVPAPTITAGSGVTVSPSVVATAATTPVVTVQINDGASPVTITATTTMPAVTVSTGTGVTVSPAAIAGAVSTPAVTVTGDGNVAAATVAGAATTPAPTVTQGAGVTVNAVTVATAATTPAATAKVNDGASPATIVAVATVPAVTITTSVDVTINAATIAGVAGVPAPTVTQGTGVTVNAVTVAATSTVPVPEAVGGTRVVELDTIEGLAAVPAPTLTLGQGVTVSPAVVVATTTADASVVVGQGATVAPVEVRVLAAIPDLGLKRLVVLPTSNILPQIDVIPYHVSDPARSLARFRRPGAKGRNVFILTNGSVTTQQPGNSALISRTIYGGHESPDDLTSTELDALVAAGYSVEVR